MSRIPAHLAIGRSVRVIGSEHFANNMRANLLRKGPSTTMRSVAIIAAFASLAGCAFALLVASF